MLDVSRQLLVVPRYQLSVCGRRLSLRLVRRSGTRCLTVCIIVTRWQRQLQTFTQGEPVCNCNIQHVSGSTKIYNVDNEVDGIFC